MVVLVIFLVVLLLTKPRYGLVVWEGLKTKKIWYASYTEQVDVIVTVNIFIVTSKTKFGEHHQCKLGGAHNN